MNKQDVTNSPGNPYGLAGLIISVPLILATAALLGLASYLLASVLIGERAVLTFVQGVGAHDVKVMHAAPLDMQKVFFLLLVFGFVLLLIPTVLAAIWRGRSKWRKLLALSWPKRLPPVLWLIIFVLALPLYLVGASLTIKYFVPEFSTWFFVPPDLAGRALSFIPIVLMAPLAEEVLFRGWIYTSLRNSFRPSVAVMVTTVLFALAHTDGGLLYPAAVFLPGLMLALVREYTGSTLASFAAHALYNGWAWLLVLVLGKDLV